MMQTLPSLHNKITPHTHRCQSALPMSHVLRSGSDSFLSGAGMRFHKNRASFLHSKVVQCQHHYLKCLRAHAHKTTE